MTSQDIYKETIHIHIKMIYLIPIKWEHSSTMQNIQDPKISKKI